MPDATVAIGAWCRRYDKKLVLDGRPGKLILREAFTCTYERLHRAPWAHEWAARAYLPTTEELEADKPKIFAPEDLIMGVLRNTVQPCVVINVYHPSLDMPYPMYEVRSPFAAPQARLTLLNAREEVRPFREEDKLRYRVAALRGRW